MFVSIFFNATPTTDIYTLSTRRSSDLQPIRMMREPVMSFRDANLRIRAEVQLAAEHERHHARQVGAEGEPLQLVHQRRSEEHTSELQSQSNIVCRLLLEKKKEQRRHNI